MTSGDRLAQPARAMTVLDQAPGLFPMLGGASRATDTRERQADKATALS